MGHVSIEYRDAPTSPRAQLEVAPAEAYGVAGLRTLEAPFVLISLAAGGPGDNRSYSRTSSSNGSHRFASPGSRSCPTGCTTSSGISKPLETPADFEGVAIPSPGLSDCRRAPPAPRSASRGSFARRPQHSGAQRLRAGSSPTRGRRRPVPRRHVRCRKHRLLSPGRGDRDQNRHARPAAPQPTSPRRWRPRPPATRRNDRGPRRARRGCRLLPRRRNRREGVAVAASGHARQGAPAARRTRARSPRPAPSCAASNASRNPATNPRRVGRRPYRRPVGSTSTGCHVPCEHGFCLRLEAFAACSPIPRFAPPEPPAPEIAANDGVATLSIEGDRPNTGRLFFELSWAGIPQRAPCRGRTGVLRGRDVVVWNPDTPCSSHLEFTWKNESGDLEPSCSLAGSSPAWLQKAFLGTWKRVDCRPAKVPSTRGGSTRIGRNRPC